MSAIRASVVGLDRRSCIPDSPRDSKRRRPTRFESALVLALLAACLQGCASSSSDTRWSRHFDADVLGGALGAQVHRPDRYVPELALVATIPVAFVYDDDIHAYESKHSVDSSTRFAADALQVILPAIPLTLGIIDWAGGDSARHLEVSVESLGGVVLIQQALANTVDRERPNGKDNTSFPSGHSSWAFAATTLIVRNLHDPSDDSFHVVDALLYLPAIFGAWERVAVDKHWASDAACGALLGVLFTNWVWDAHYKGERETRATIFVDPPHRGVAWSPCVEMIDGRVAFGVRGGF